MHLTIVTNIIPPYRHPLFESLGKELRLTVLYEDNAIASRQWRPWVDEDAANFESQGLGGPVGDSGWLVRPSRTVLWRALEKREPDAVVSSEFGWRSIVSMAYCRKVEIPFLIWSAATLRSEKGRSHVRKLVRRALVMRTSAFLPVGKEAERHLLSLGASPDTCFLSPNAVINLRNTVDFAHLEERAKEIRSNNPGFTVLYCGTLSARKGVDLLLDAFRQIDTSLQVRLWIAGEGPLGEELKKLVVDSGLSRIRFLGFLSEAEKWKVFLASDLFVFPTLGDTWGMVLNEAMEAGMPVVCSPFAGAAKDMVVDGVNGLIIDPRSPRMIAGAIEKLAEDQDFYNALSDGARRTISHYTIGRARDGFLMALDHLGFNGIRRPLEEET